MTHSQHTAFYDQYTRSSAWEEKKRQRSWIDGGKCVMCGRSEAHTRSMQCHHVTYARLGHENPYTDLVTVCGSCHKKLHRYLARQTQEPHNGISLEEFNAILRELGANFAE